MIAMLEIRMQLQEQALPMPRKFVRREVCDSRQAAVAVVGREFSVLDPESEGYNPYDHAPPPPARADDLEVRIRSRIAALNPA